MIPATAFNNDPELVDALKNDNFEAFVVWDFKHRIRPNGTVEPPTTDEPFSILVAFRKIQANHPSVGSALAQQAKQWLAKWKFSASLT